MQKSSAKLKCTLTVTPYYLQKPHKVSVTKKSIFFLNSRSELERWEEGKGARKLLSGKGVGSGARQVAQLC